MTIEVIRFLNEILSWKKNGLFYGLLGKSEFMLTRLGLQTIPGYSTTNFKDVTATYK